MGNDTFNMSKEKMHQALSEYVSQKIVNNDSEFSYAEWVTLMNDYSRHESIDAAAKQMHLTKQEVIRVYYAFTMCAAEYAMTHLS